MGCISEIGLELRDVGEHLSMIACSASCSRFIKALQVSLYPWHKCAASSKVLFELEEEITREHTQLCSKLSNFDGLARFFTENRDKVPRADILKMMPELEDAVKRGLERLHLLIRKIQSVSCPPFSEHRDETIRRGLANFTALLEAKAKAQFHVSSRLYERLLHQNRAFSPRASPRGSPRIQASPVESRASEVDLDSL